MYKQLDNQDISFLKTLFSDGNIQIGNEISFDYGKDEMGTVHHMPEAMVFPETTEQISKLMQYANKNLIPVTVRGTGTGLVGGCVPVLGGIVLNTTKMNKIIELDEQNLTLTVEPGVLLLDIYSYVESRGFFYPPDPGEKTATIGGNISTNAGGMRAVKYGTTRDWVMEIEVVLPNGDIEHFGRKVVKDSTGYALKHLMIGSEGTLGIITKAVLKLTPKPTESISLLVPFPSREEALEAVPEILKANVNPIAIEFFEKNTIILSEKFNNKKFPDTKSDAYILLTFEGNTKDELRHNYEKAAYLCVNNLNAIDALLVDTDERKESVWKARGAFLEAIKSSTTDMDECDVVVPRSEIANYIKFTYELQDKYKVRIPSFGHAGDGNLHIYICKDNLSDEEFQSKLELVFKDLYNKAHEVNGLASGEHGIGYAKKEYMKEILGENQIKLMQGIKKVFDPNNILNPKKICD